MLTVELCSYEYRLYERRFNYTIHRTLTELVLRDQPPTVVPVK